MWWRSRHYREASKLPYDVLGDGNTSRMPNASKKGLTVCCWQVTVAPCLVHIALRGRRNSYGWQLNALSSVPSRPPCLHSARSQGPSPTIARRCLREVSSLAGRLQYTRWQLVQARSAPWLGLWQPKWTLSRQTQQIKASSQIHSKVVPCMERTRTGRWWLCCTWLLESSYSIERPSGLARPWLQVL